MVVIQSHSASNSLPFEIFTKIKIFLKNPSLSLKKKTIFKHWEKMVLFSVFFSGNYSTLSDFWKKLLSQSNSAANLLNLAIMKNFRIFPWKPHLLFFWKNPSFTSFENFYYFSRSLQQIIYVQLLAVSNKNQNFVSKNPSNCWKNAKFECFKKLRYFSRLLQQICYLERLLKKFNIFFRRTHLFLFNKKKFHVLRISISSVAFNIKISTSKF